MASSFFARRIKSTNPPQSGKAETYLEVVCCVAVCVLWDMQEDEEILPDVVGYCRQDRQAVLREAELHHFV